jgi:putative FmdB family regulatory protein
MPIYEYECGSCGGRFDVSRKFSDPADTVCVLCNAANVKKVLSTPAFVLKGGGWYATDYPSADRKQGGEADRKQGGETEKTATDPKPAAGCASGVCAGTCPSKGPA